MEFPEAQPATLGDGTVLCLSTRARDGGLTLGRLRHQVVTKVDVVARRGVAGVRATCPVRI
jgi:hypothetical protein